MLFHLAHLTHADFVTISVIRYSILTALLQPILNCSSSTPLSTIVTSKTKMVLLQCYSTGTLLQYCYSTFVVLSLLWMYETCAKETRILNSCRGSFIESLCHVKKTFRRSKVTIMTSNQIFEGRQGMPSKVCFSLSTIWAVCICKRRHQRSPLQHRSEFRKTGRTYPSKCCAQIA